MTNCVQKSIAEKWEPILRGKHKPQGPLDCECCKQHYWGPGDCEQCPIKQYTGKTLCLNTPIESFDQIRFAFLGWAVFDLHAELTACAQWEIDFLNEVLISNRNKR